VRIPRNVMYHKNLKAEVFSRESVFVPMNLAPNFKRVSSINCAFERILKALF
jgi:hypothetical protein